MQGIKRRIVYVSSYEIIGMVISSVRLAILAGDSVEHTGPLSVMITTIAVTWNFIYNILYENGKLNKAVISVQLSVELDMPSVFSLLWFCF